MDTKSRVTYVCGECGEENKGKLGVWETKKKKTERSTPSSAFSMWIYLIDIGHEEGTCSNVSSPFCLKTLCFDSETW